VRGGASLLLGLAIVAACGHPFDTSVQPDPIDASAEAGMTAATDATPPSKEASVGDDDADAGIADADADAGSDAGDMGRDADSGIVVVPTCTTFNETFPNPWQYQTQGWNLPPAQPYFIVTTFAELQASTTGSPNSTVLTHNVATDCRAHLKLDLKISDDTTNIADVTMIHFGSTALAVDVIRRKSSVLDVVYAGSSHAIGQFNATVWYTLDIDIPKDGGAVTILLNGTAASQPLTMSASPSKITQLQLGVVEIKNASQGTNAVVDVDNIELNVN
jgi:hypothetical protein